MSAGPGTKRIVVLQPSYLPWLGYFDQLYKSDVFVLYDDVQYDKHGWRNRNRIKTDKGPLWLTVPVLTHGQGLPTNRDARIDTRQPWARKHLQALRVNYAKAPAFEEVFGALEPVLGRPWTYLIDLNRAVLETLCRLLGLTRLILLSSELDVPGQKSERLIGLCRALGAGRYLTGDAASDYLDETQFAAHAIRVEYHHYRHPVYAQLHGEFVPYLSVVDLLMNHGRESLGVLVDGDIQTAEELTT
ncbi:MAG TPA: WbqC family protein [Methylomirabilota bacterium]|nr:WbqC family protein [Methylomirabilota bacterium]